jgi:hypothetical protein
MRTVCMPRGLIVSTLLAGGAVSSSSAQAGKLTIEHAPVACATVDRFTEIEARLSPRDAVAKARVMFRAADSEHWYFVLLTAGKDGRFTAQLPKPLPQLKAFDYYIDAQTASFDDSRTPDRRVDVVGRNATCGTGFLAGSAASVAARLVVTALSGGPALPAGFASSGLVAGAAASGAATKTAGSGGAGAGAAGAGAAGGGLSGTTLGIVGGVVAAAGVAAGVAAAGGGDGDHDTCCHTGVFSIAFTPFIALSDCVAPGVQPQQLNGINFSIPSGVKQPQGNFDSTVGPSALPYPVKMVGFISPTSFNATLSCVSGAPNATTISATGSDYNFSGSLTFSGRSGTWTVRSLSSATATSSRPR